MDKWVRESLFLDLGFSKLRWPTCNAFLVKTPNCINHKVLLWEMIA
jgi:hypothetical protein